jgi:hypothetical protein
MPSEFSSNSGLQFNNRISSPATRYMGNHFDFLPSLLDLEKDGFSLKYEDKRQRINFGCSIFTESGEQAWNLANFFASNFNIDSPAYFNSIGLRFEIPYYTIAKISEYLKLPLKSKDDVLFLVNFLNERSNIQFDLFINENTGRLSLGFLAKRNVIISFSKPDVEVQRKDSVIEYGKVSFAGWVELSIPNQFLVSSQEELTSYSESDESLFESNPNNIPSISFIKKVLLKNIDIGVKKVEFSISSSEGTVIESFKFINYLPEPLKTYLKINRASDKYSVILIEDSTWELEEGKDYLVDKINGTISIVNPKINSTYNVGIYLTKEANVEFNKISNEENT